MQKWHTGLPTAAQKTKGGKAMNYFALEFIVGSRTAVHRAFHDMLQIMHQRIASFPRSIITRFLILLYWSGGTSDTLTNWLGMSVTTFRRCCSMITDVPLSTFAMNIRPLPSFWGRNRVGACFDSAILTLIPALARFLCRYRMSRCCMNADGIPGHSPHVSMSCSLE